MFDILLTRFRQRHRTMRYPDSPPSELPDRFTGKPVITPTSLCAEGCKVCTQVCSTDAIQVDQNGFVLDMGKCLFCRACEHACESHTITFSKEHQLAAGQREDLVVKPLSPSVVSARHELAAKLFKRSLKLRQLSAGGCNACEADSNVLGTLTWDMGRFGIQFAASPRHADGLLITGPVTQNMQLALQKTYEAVPSPKIVIAVGACAISGGPYIGHPEQCGGASSVVPVDLFIPGCPPHPLTILDGLLRFLGYIPEEFS